jgi:hypothetical protein
MLHNNRLRQILSLAFSFAVVSFAVPSLHGQDSPSLADLARQARDAKNKGTHAAPGADSPASTTMSTAPVNSQPTTSEASDRRSDETNRLSKADILPNGMDLHYLDDYEDGIRRLFEEGKFESVDQLADTARSTRARLPGGYWALHTIYIPLVLPAKGTDDASEAEWTAQTRSAQTVGSAAPKIRHRARCSCWRISSIWLEGTRQRICERRVRRWMAAFSRTRG